MKSFKSLEIIFRKRRKEHVLRVRYRLKATYARPGMDFAPVRSTHVFVRVIPCDLWIVRDHASNSGTCLRQTPFRPGSLYSNGVIDTSLGSSSEHEGLYKQEIEQRQLAENSESLHRHHKRYRAQSQQNHCKEPSVATDFTFGCHRFHINMTNAPTDKIFQDSAPNPFPFYLAAA